MLAPDTAFALTPANSSSSSVSSSIATSSSVTTESKSSPGILTAIQGLFKTTPDEKKKSVKKDKIYPYLEIGEYEYIRKLLMKHPEHTEFDPQNRTLNPEGHLKHLVYRLKSGFCVVGKEKGQGNWGTVNECLIYQLDSYKHPEKCVAKFPKAPGVIDSFLNELLSSDANNKFKLEADVSKLLYGFGEYLEFQKDNKLTLILFLPFLGEMTLAYLLSHKKLLKDIPITQWINLLIMLPQLVSIFHSATGKIHNDIKPENIVLTCDYMTNRKHKKEMKIVAFSKIALIDLGSAHTKNTFGLFGDIKYAPKESFMCLSHLKDEKIDIYALGKTLLEIHDVIVKYYKEDLTTHTLNRAEVLFRRMTAILPFERPSLKEVIDGLFKIQHLHTKHLIVETDSSDDMNDLRNRSMSHGEMPAGGSLSNVVSTSPSMESLTKGMAERHYAKLVSQGTAADLQRHSHDDLTSLPKRTTKVIRDSGDFLFSKKSDGRGRGTKSSKLDTLPAVTISELDLAVAVVPRSNVPRTESDPAGIHVSQFRK